MARRATANLSVILWPYVHRNNEIVNKIAFSLYSSSASLNPVFGDGYPYQNIRSLVGGSGEIIFVNQSNFFLNNNADRHPSSRNRHQEYSFHLYCGGTSLTKHPISTILCNYVPASGKAAQSAQMRHRVDLNI